jgi:vacuolar-type H+-ATPase subunit I/STV1
MQLEVKGSVLDAKRKSVITLYQSLDHPKSYDSWVRKGLIFDQITKQNKEVNVAFQDMLKLIKELVIPADKKTEMLGAVYTELMNFYTEQNKGLTEMMSSGFQLPKSAQKTQKALNKYIEKYMTEMTKLMSEMK